METVKKMVMMMDEDDGDNDAESIEMVIIMKIVVMMMWWELMMMTMTATAISCAPTWVTYYVEHFMYTVSDYHNNPVRWRLASPSDTWETEAQRSEVTCPGSERQHGKALIEISAWIVTPNPVPLTTHLSASLIYSSICLTILKSSLIYSKYLLSPRYTEDSC